MYRSLIITASVISPYFSKWFLNVPDSLKKNAKKRDKIKERISNQHNYNDKQNAQFTRVLRHLSYLTQFTSMVITNPTKANSQTVTTREKQK